MLDELKGTALLNGTRGRRPVSRAAILDVLLKIGGEDGLLMRHAADIQEADINPRKDIARKMIMLVRQINSNFPGTGVFPVGNQMVTCWTCHRGDVNPVSLGNKAYPPPAPKQ